MSCGALWEITRHRTPTPDMAGGDTFVKSENANAPLAFPREYLSLKSENANTPAAPPLGREINFVKWPGNVISDTHRFTPGSRPSGADTTVQGPAVAKGRYVSPMESMTSEGRRNSSNFSGHSRAKPLRVCMRDPIFVAGWSGGPALHARRPPARRDSACDQVSD